MLTCLYNQQTMAKITRLRLHFMSREDCEVAKSHPPTRSPCIWPIWHNLGTRNRNLANRDYFSLPSQISIGHYQITPLYLGAIDKLSKYFWDWLVFRKYDFILLKQRNDVSRNRMGADFQWGWLFTKGKMGVTLNVSPWLWWWDIGVRWWV